MEFACWALDTRASERKPAHVNFRNEILQLNALRTDSVPGGNISFKDALLLVVSLVRAFRCTRAESVRCTRRQLVWCINVLETVDGEVIVGKPDEQDVQSHDLYVVARGRLVVVRTDLLVLRGATEETRPRSGRHWNITIVLQARCELLRKADHVFERTLVSLSWQACCSIPCGVKNFGPFSDPLIELRHQSNAPRVVRDGAEITDGQSDCQACPKLPGQCGRNKDRDSKTQDVDGGSPVIQSRRRG